MDEEYQTNICIIITSDFISAHCNKVTAHEFANNLDVETFVLFVNITSTVFLLQTFSENELNSFEFKSLQDTLNEVRNELDGNNIK